MAAEPSGPQLEPGLRERKKAQTRQRISDTATVMFLQQGFDAVRVADVAAQAGVSEKTVFNYFPTKESLVFDRADEQLAAEVRAVSQRPAGVSPVSAYAAELKRQLREFADEDFTPRRDFIPRFGAMVEATPALRAAWGDHRHRAVAALAAVLAADIDVDAREPEVLSAARALVSLSELMYDSVLRHVESAASGAQLYALVVTDLDRGGRLLDTGLWSLPLLIGRRRTAEQLRDAAAAADQARRQVLNAVREAKRAWREAQRHLDRHDRRPAPHASARDERRLRGRGRA